MREWNDCDPPHVGEAPDETLPLLRTQAELYARLDGLTANQRSLITADDTSALLAHLALRKKVVDELSAISQRLDPIRRNWSAVREQWAEAQREEAERLIGDVEGRLRRMIERDEEDVRVLSARKHEVGRTLRTAHTKGQALTAYRAPVGAVPGRNLLDESSE